MSKTTTRVRSTKKYRSLIAAGLNDNEALNVLGDTTTPRKQAASTEVSAEVNTEVVDNDDPVFRQLVDGGFTAAQARDLMAKGDKPAKAKKGGKKKGKGKKAKAAKPETLSAKDRADALVASQGLAFTRGRVYTTPDIIEAQVRVLKTGRPEVVMASGNGHVTAVQVYRTDSGDCCVQNLKKPV